MYSIKFNQETELFSVVDSDSNQELKFFIERKEAASYIRELKREDSNGIPLTNTVHVKGTYGYRSARSNKKEKVISVPVTITVKASDYEKKADAVRAIIKQVKDQHGSMNSVIEFAITELKMTRHLAREYTRNNWDTV